MRTAIHLAGATSSISGPRTKTVRGPLSSTPAGRAARQLTSAGFAFARKALPESSVYEFAGSAATAAGPVTLADETPRRRFVKDLIRVGEYVNGGEQIAITAADIDRWAKAGNDFIAAGNDVPVPDGHTDDATANRGYAREFYRDGDTLYAIVEMIGADGIATAARSKVSIKTDLDYVDGKGNKYPNLITHIALTNAPVVPDQNGFVPIAASRGGKPTRARLFRLALSTENSMEHLTKIATMLGVTVDGLDEAALAAAIAKSIETMQGMSKQADATADAAKAETAAIKASLSKPAKTVDPMLAKVVGENRGLKLARLVDGGKITPAVRDRIGAIKFAIDPDGEGQFEAMVAALGENDAVKLGEQTLAQGMKLSRATGDAPATFDAKVNADMAVMAFGPKAK